MQITLSTVGCVTSSVFPPLLYAYYYVANDNGDLKQLSLQSADSVVSVVGPSAFEVSNEVIFVAEVGLFLVDEGLVYGYHNKRLPSQ